jgi:hypothetical protein
VLILALGAARDGRAAPPLCEASAALAPAVAWPGQQVAWQLRILVREGVREVAWEQPPAFPGLRAERLPNDPTGELLLRDGARFEVREERRALFAERAGTLRLPSARLRCRASAPTGGELAEEVATPELALVVQPLPEAGRPVGFTGLVGPLVVRRHSIAPAIRLGQSLRLAWTLQGEGNLWDAARPPLTPETLGGAEVFDRPESLELDRGERLSVYRRFFVDVVPRREGVLSLPGFAWSYYDPAAQRYAEARSEPLEVRVGPPAPPPAADRAPGASRSPSRGSAEPSEAAPRAIPRTALFLTALAAAGAALAAAARVFLRRLAEHRATRRAELEALAHADAAGAAGDRDAELAALSRALRIALAADAGSTREGSPGSLPAAALLAQLERARFDPATPAPDRSAIDAALAALGARRTRAARRASARAPRA